MKVFRFLFTLLLLCVFWGCKNPDDDYIDPRGKDFAGSQSCVQCHKDAVHSALQDVHWKATAIASDTTILGNFTKGQNVFDYGANKKIVMEKRGDQYFQVLYENGKEVKAYAFDIVFGTKHAQNSVYWNHKNTFELPVSYYEAAHGWATSPNYSATTPNFDRKVNRDCYECHSSNASNRAVSDISKNNTSIFMDIDDQIEPKSIIYGIDCERCHGPAKKHVDYHLKFPDVKTPHEIVSFQSLTNQQKLDACAVCHSKKDGRMKLKSRFQFKPGDDFSKFYRGDLSGYPSNGPQNDVHGNQLGLLSQSQCFKGATMNCVSCHNSHQQKKPTLASYSAICINCHQQARHSAATVALSDNLKQNCIDCHMPKQESETIEFLRQGKSQSERYMLRTHKIAVYP